MKTMEDHHSARAHNLSIDLNHYTDGDKAYEKELVTLLVANLRETCERVKSSIENDDMNTFHKTVHKAQIAFRLLNDDVLNKAISEIADGHPGIRKSALAVFGEHCEGIIASLNELLERK